MNSIIENHGNVQASPAGTASLSAITLQLLSILKSRFLAARSHAIRGNAFYFVNQIEVLLSKENMCSLSSTAGRHSNLIVVVGRTSYVISCLCSEFFSLKNVRISQITTM